MKILLLILAISFSTIAFSADTENDICVLHPPSTSSEKNEIIDCYEVDNNYFDIFIDGEEYELIYEIIEDIRLEDNSGIVLIA